MQNSPPSSFFADAQIASDAPVPQTRTSERLSFLKQVYKLLTLTVAFATLGAAAALYVGADSAELVFRSPSGVVVPIPPIVAFFGEHYIISFILLLGSVLFTSSVRSKPQLNTAALLGMGFIAGLTTGPLVFVAQVAALQGSSLTLTPVRDAFITAVVAFSGLTGYVMITKKDFSYLRGFLTMGFFVVLAALLLSFFFGSSILSLAVSSVGVVLFAGYTLYDTSKLLRSYDDGMDISATGGAINLFLDFLNLFVFLLRIFAGGRR